MTPLRMNILGRCVGAAALPLLASASTLATDVVLPYSKPGLWSMSQMDEKDTAPIVTQLCIDKLTQKYLVDAGNSILKSNCSKYEVSAKGATVTSTSVCKFGGSTVNSSTVLTFAGDSAFNGQITSHFSPSFMGTTDSHISQTGQWTGACPAGMAPGDMIGPHGIKLHMGPNGPVPVKR